MCMNKEFVVEEIDPFQTINRFIRKVMQLFHNMAIVVGQKQNGLLKYHL